MKGQFSRLTARRGAKYSSVRFQQGRVQLDADLNEQIDISLRREQLMTLDVVGQSGVPEGAAGFGLVPILSLTALDASGNAIRAVGTRGTVASSGDGGANWALQAVPAGASDHDLVAVSVFDANTALAVGSAGDVLLQTDGASWTAATTPTGATVLRAAVLVSATTGWVVGDNGMIAGTADGGTSWTVAVAAGVTETLRAAHFPTATAGWAVGDAGRIVATADGGATWAAQTPPAGTAARLHGVRFAADAKHGWAVGDAATILATSDGGATWTANQGPTGVDVTLRGVHVFDATNVWAVGDHGTVLRTTDGGTSWNVVRPAATWAAVDLRGVHATAADAAIVAGDQSVLAAVTMAGDVPTWLPSPLLDGRDLGISVGRLYVDGLLVENDVPARYLGQSSLPGASFPGAGTYRAYIDASTRHLTALDRPELREVALGGPDTATRTQTVWQVRLDPTNLPTATCASLPSGWQPTGASTARMRARSAPTPVQTNDCLVPAGGGYKRLENQLYRVEVHASGAAGAATYKWSRENGSVVARLIGSDTTAATVTVDDPGHDPRGDFADAAWVELTDDARILTGQPGFLLRVQGVSKSVIQLATPVAPAQPTMADFGPGAIVRRWDGTGTVTTADWLNLATADAATPSDGVDVEFAGDSFVTGDYWALPARTLTGDVEWPSVDGAPQFQSRDGDQHHYASLAVIAVDAQGAVTVADDCRLIFPPLSGMETLVYSSGDGQEVPRGGSLALPDPVVVAVTRGPIAVEGATVRFTVADGGTVNTATPSATVPTNADGLASATWELANAIGPQHLTAELIDASGNRRGTPVEFQARLRSADSISYDPTCADLQAANATTVQAAIDALCARPSGGGGGCCHVVGKTEAQAGEYPDLLEALKDLIVNRKQRDICICLLPNKYELSPDDLNGLIKSMDGSIDRLEIGGAGALIVVDPGGPIQNIGQVNFRDVEFVAANGGSAIGFAGESSPGSGIGMAVGLIGVSANAVEVPDDAPLITFDACGAVRVTGCTLSVTGRSTSKVHELLPQIVREFVDVAATANSNALLAAYGTLVAQPVDLRAEQAKELSDAIAANPDVFSGDVAATAQQFVELLQTPDPGVPSPLVLGKRRAGWRPLFQALQVGELFPSAIALVTPSADVVIERNRITGGVTLGPPGRDLERELEIEKNLLVPSLFAPWSGAGRLSIDGNALDWIAFGARWAQGLTDSFATAAAQGTQAAIPDATFAQVLITNNTFQRAPHAVLGEVVSMNGNMFATGAPLDAGQRLGFAITTAVAVVGNIGPARPPTTDFEAQLVLSGWARGETTNVRVRVLQP